MICRSLTLHTIILTLALSGCAGLQSKESALSFIDRGYSHFRERDCQGSLAAFREAERIGFEDPDVWLMQSLSLRCLKQYDEALEVLDKAEVIKPGWTILTTQRSMISMNKDDLEEAEALARAAVVLEPKKNSPKKLLCEILIRQGRSFEELGRYDEALLKYEEVFRILPFSKGYRTFQTGNLHLKKNDIFKAKEISTEAASPDSTPFSGAAGLILLGLYLDAENRVSEANSSFAMANKLYTGAIVFFANDNRPGIVKHLLDNGADVNARSEKDWSTSLVYAAKRGHLRTARVLIKYSADLEAVTSAGSNPLNEAIASDHPEMVDLLIKNGANIEFTTNNGMTPLLMATKKDRKEILRILISHGADLSAIDDNGSTAINLAAGHCRKEVLDILLGSGFEVDSRDNRGRTPLMKAAVKGMTENMSLLLDSGAEQSLVDNNGNTALSLAAQAGFPRAIEELIRRGSNIDHKNKEKMTPLMLSVIEGHGEAVRLLLERGAEVNVMDDRGISALIWARTHKRLEIADILLDSGAVMNQNDPDPKKKVEIFGKITLIVDGKVVRKEGWTPKHIMRIFQVESYGVKPPDPAASSIDGDGAFSIKVNRGTHFLREIIMYDIGKTFKPEMVFQVPYGADAFYAGNITFNLMSDPYASKKNIDLIILGVNITDEFDQEKIEYGAPEMKIEKSLVCSLEETDLKKDIINTKWYRRMSEGNKLNFLGPLLNAWLFL